MSGVIGPSRLPEGFGMSGDWGGAAMVSLGSKVGSLSVVL